ncbi:MAG: signal peptidase II [Devosiaceae bacterium]|nr:signal peptidase II [Devosiaceae bacterium]
MSVLQKKSALFSFIFGFDVFLIDRVHKFYQLDIEGWSGGEYVQFLPFLDYTMVWNRGISYGLLGNLPQPAIMVILGVALAMLVWWWTTAKDFLPRLGLALALGGALSNIVDRVFYGAVADFFHLFWGDRSFFVFNLADLAITLGALILILDTLLPKRQLNT